MTHATTPAQRIVCNSRPGVDWNTCGQAAVATVLARFGLGPFAPGRATPSDGEAIDFVARTHPPDVPFGLGTSAFRLVAALGGAGLRVEHVHSGWFGVRRAEAWRRLRDHVAAGSPAIVCVDRGLLGGIAWSAHWAPAIALAPDRVRLGNCGEEELPLGRFEAAWQCRQLPVTHNHCAILVRI